MPRKMYEMQDRCVRGSEDAAKIAKAGYPYAKTKKKAVQDIIDHYDQKETNRKNENVVRRHKRAPR